MKSKPAVFACKNSSIRSHYWHCHASNRINSEGKTIKSKIATAARKASTYSTEIASSNGLPRRQSARSAAHLTRRNCKNQSNRTDSSWSSEISRRECDKRCPTQIVMQPSETAAAICKFNYRVVLPALLVAALAWPYWSIKMRWHSRISDDGLMISVENDK